MPKVEMASSLSSSFRTIKASLLVSLVVIALLASAFVYEYSILSSDLSAKESTIASQSAYAKSQASSIVSLGTMLDLVHAQIRTLNSTLTLLQANQTVLLYQRQVIELRISGLQNASSQLQLELSLVEQGGKLNVLPFYINATMTVAGNSTVLLAGDVNGYNGTVIFLSPFGCASGGTETGSIQPVDTLYILLNGASGGGESGGLTSALFRIGPAPFSVYFRNTGSVSEECTFSLAYVYHT